MKEERDYVKDIAEIRAMMERSSKFLSLSGWAGVMAGLYALAGAAAARYLLGFHPDSFGYAAPRLPALIGLALAVLAIALVSALYFSWRQARRNGERIWNATSRRLLANMAVPLLAGGILIVICIGRGLTGMAAPLSLLFYGAALFSAGHFTIAEVKLMGVIQMALGLLNAWFIGTGLLFWALGFGVVHIAYGIYMYFRFER